MKKAVFRSFFVAFPIRVHLFDLEAGHRRTQSSAGWAVAQSAHARGHPFLDCPRTGVWTSNPQGRDQNQECKTQRNRWYKDVQRNKQNSRWIQMVPTMASQNSSLGRLHTVISEYEDKSIGSTSTWELRFAMDPSPQTCPVDSPSPGPVQFCLILFNSGRHVLAELLILLALRKASGSPPAPAPDIRRGNRTPVRAPSNGSWKLGQHLDLVVAYCFLSLLQVWVGQHE